MSSFDELEISDQFLYIQVDLKGNILDANSLFNNTYGELPDNSICSILFPDDIEMVIAATERIKRKTKNPIIVRVETKRGSKTHLSMWKIIYIKGTFIALGNEFEEKLIFALNHKIRSHSANIEGLAQFIESIEDVQIAKMLYTSAVALNAEIAALMKLLSNRS